LFEETFLRNFMESLSDSCKVGIVVNRCRRKWRAPDRI